MKVRISEDTQCCLVGESISLLSLCVPTSVRPSGIEKQSLHVLSQKCSSAAMATFGSTRHTHFITRTVCADLHASLKALESRVKRKQNPLTIFIQLADAFIQSDLQYRCTFSLVS